VRISLPKAVLHMLYLRHTSQEIVHYNVESGDYQQENMVFGNLFLRFVTHRYAAQEVCSEDNGVGGLQHVSRLFIKQSVNFFAAEHEGYEINHPEQIKHYAVNSSHGGKVLIGIKGFAGNQLMQIYNFSL
jgi:hypothetical protein